MSAGKIRARKGSRRLRACRRRWFVDLVIAPCGSARRWPGRDTTSFFGPEATRTPPRAASTRGEDGAWVTPGMRVTRRSPVTRGGSSRTPRGGRGDHPPARSARTVGSPPGLSISNSRRNANQASTAAAGQEPYWSGANTHTPAAVGQQGTRESDSLSGARRRAARVGLASAIRSSFSGVSRRGGRRGPATRTPGSARTRAERGHVRAPAPRSVPAQTRQPARTGDVFVLPSGRTWRWRPRGTPVVNAGEGTPTLVHRPTLSTARRRRHTRISPACRRICDAGDFRADVPNPSRPLVSIDSHFWICCASCGCPRSALPKPWFIPIITRGPRRDEARTITSRPPGTRITRCSDTRKRKKMSPSQDTNVTCSETSPSYRLVHLRGEFLCPSRGPTFP